MYTAAQRTLRNTHFPTLLWKLFLIFGGPFPGPLGLLPLVFEFPYFRYTNSNFSRRFDLHYRFLLHGSAKGLNYRVQSPCAGAGPIYAFFKKKFQNLLGPFPSPWGAFALHFRIPLLTLLIPIFFSKFRLFLHLLLQGIHLLMISTHLLLTGVTNLRPVALKWPTFFTTPSTSSQTSPLHLEAVEPYLHRHPYARFLLVL